MPDTETTNDPDSHPDQDWGQIALCVAIAIIVAIGVHYVAFGVVLTNLSFHPTIHALVGMILFFIAGFASFSIFY